MADRDRYRRILSSRIFILVYVALALVLLQGCAGLRPRNPLPEDLESKVQVTGMPGVRVLGG